MPKARVLVTVTAEAVIEVPADVEDVDSYCSANAVAGMDWGNVTVVEVIQPPAISVASYRLPDTQPLAGSEEAVVGWSAEEVAEPLPDYVETVEEVAAAAGVSAVPMEMQGITAEQVLELFGDPTYQEMIRSAVRERAASLVEAIVQQVVSELEPLLRRRFGQQGSGA
jgi:nucleotide-binding universal stress UspA family protein